LWLGSLVSLTGTQMQFVALPYFVYERARGPALTGALQLNTRKVRFILGPTGRRVLGTAWA
jgi:hypothetical protein